MADSDPIGEFGNLPLGFSTYFLQFTELLGCGAKFNFDAELVIEEQSTKAQLALEFANDTGPQHRKPSSRKALIRSSFNGGYDRIRPSLDIESNLISGIVRGGRSVAVPRKLFREILRLIDELRPKPAPV